MYRITIECRGIRADEGPSAASDIEAEFRTGRTWHIHPRCTYEDGRLLFTATNDFDADGLALLDEVGDCLVAFLSENGPVKILGIETVQG